MQSGPDKIPVVMPLGPAGSPVPNNEPEITNEPDDVNEQSPELYEDFLDKNDEAMEEQTDDAAEDEDE